MPIQKFSKCKRRFDVTVRVSTWSEIDPFGERRRGYHLNYEGSVCVWAFGPSLHHMIDAVLDELKIEKRGARVALLYVREHEFEEYTPAQMGRMMAQEGYGVSDNPYAGIDNIQADSWSDAHEKEILYMKRKAL